MKVSTSLGLSAAAAAWLSFAAGAFATGNPAPFDNDSYAAPTVARRKRDLVVETINGAPALGSAHVESFRAAGYRLDAGGLRWMK